MKEEEDSDQAHDDCLFQQIALQRFDGRVDQARAVVSGHHFNALRQRWLNLLELLLDAVDDVQRILSESHYDDPANCFTLAVPFRYAAANIGAEGDRSEITD